MFGYSGWLEFAFFGVAFDGDASSTKAGLVEEEEVVDDGLIDGVLGIGAILVGWLGGGTGGSFCGGFALRSIVRF